MQSSVAPSEPGSIAAPDLDVAAPPAASVNHGEDDDSSGSSVVVDATGVVALPDESSGCSNNISSDSSACVDGSADAPPHASSDGGIPSSSSSNTGADVTQQQEDGEALLPAEGEATTVAIEVTPVVEAVVKRGAKGRKKVPKGKRGWKLGRKRKPVATPTNTDSISTDGMAPSEEGKVTAASPIAPVCGPVENGSSSSTTASSTTALDSTAERGVKKPATVAEVLSALQRRTRSAKFVAAIPPEPPTVEVKSGAQKRGAKKADEVVEPPKELDKRRGPKPKLQEDVSKQEPKRRVIEASGSSKKAKREPVGEGASKATRTPKTPEAAIAPRPRGRPRSKPKGSSEPHVNVKKVQKAPEPAATSSSGDCKAIESLNAMMASAWSIANVYGDGSVAAMVPAQLWDTSKFELESAAGNDGHTPSTQEGGANVASGTSGKSKKSKLFSTLHKEVKASFSQNLHSLLEPCDFRSTNTDGTVSAASHPEQPFVVYVHPQVGVLCDVHAHLCDSEVIGLLAGTVVCSEDGANTTTPDGENGIAHPRYTMYVQQAFPCPSTVRLEDNGSTDVELDPLAELAAREAITNAGMQVVGWYHSHPSFKANPSAIDVFNQSQYQRLVRNPSTGLEPFVGLIISTYDKSLPAPASAHNWFYTIRHSEGSRNSTELDIPMNLTTNTLRLITADGESSTRMFIEDEGIINGNRSRIDAVVSAKRSQESEVPSNCSSSKESPEAENSTSEAVPASEQTTNQPVEQQDAPIENDASAPADNAESIKIEPSISNSSESFTLSGRKRRAPVLYEDVRKPKRSRTPQVSVSTDSNGPEPSPESNISTNPSAVQSIGDESSQYPDNIASALVVKYSIDDKTKMSGCDILCDVSGQMQMLVVGILSLISYYSHSNYRIDLQEKVKWKDCGSKLKKLSISVQRWFEYFRIVPADLDRFMRSFEAYLVGVWSQNKQFALS